jgi:hypothetical protein
VNVSVLSLGAYAVEFVIYGAMAVYMIAQVIRNHFEHRPVRWLMCGLAGLFVGQMPELVVRALARIKFLATGVPQPATSVWWLIGSAASMVAVVVFYGLFRYAQPSLKRCEE